MYLSRKSPLLAGLVSATAIERAGARMGLDNPTFVEHGYTRSMVGAETSSTFGLYSTESDLLQDLTDDVQNFLGRLSGDGTLYKNGVDPATVKQSAQQLLQNAGQLQASWQAKRDSGAVDSDLYTVDAQRVVYGQQLVQLGGTWNDPDPISTYEGGATADWNGLWTDIENEAAASSLNPTNWSPSTWNPFANPTSSMTTIDWILVGAGAGIIGVVALKVLL